LLNLRYECHWNKKLWVWPWWQKSIWKIFTIILNEECKNMYSAGIQTLIHTALLIAHNMNIHKYFQTMWKRKEACWYMHPWLTNGLDGYMWQTWQPMTFVLSPHIHSMKYFKHYYSFNIFLDQSLSVVLASGLGLSSSHVLDNETCTPLHTCEWHLWTSLQKRR